MTFDFTTRKNGAMTGATKWTGMDAFLKRPAPTDALPMWVAQTDFQPAPCLQDAMTRMRDAGEYGYFTRLDAFFERVAWWTETRHGWAPDPTTMFATHGLGNGIALTLRSLTEPDDGVIVFSPVYHEFYHKIRKNERRVIESQMVIDEAGLYRMDLDALEAQLDGTERAVMISAPHNPAGRCWEADEIKALAAFCIRHNLILISDEIHQDLALPGHTHFPVASLAPEALDRLVVMSAASKTFDVAGLRTGTVIIPNPDLRARFATLHAALDIAPNRAGVELTKAAYSPEGAAWVDELQAVLGRNAAILSEGVAAIPGLNAMPMQATFLAWVDFSGSGMTEEELDHRLVDEARIVTTRGPALGSGGELHRRFNIGMPTADIEVAVSRLQEAFADLQ